MKKLFLLILLTAPVLASSQEKLDKKKLDDYLEILETKNKSNLSVAVSKGGELIYEQYAGYLSAKRSQRLNANTKFKVGSISKTFTAVIIFQLIEEGKLTTETTLNKFYPDFENADKITISHLLSHQSGIHNFTDMPDFATYMTEEKSKAELVSIIKDMSSDFEPGTSTSYSNSGYMMLGFIIEELTNKTYKENLEERIIKKLDLKNTEYGDQIENEKNEATSMVFQGGNWIPFPYEWHMSIPYSAGAVVSTPRDLNIFMHALFNKQLVSDTSIAKMKEVVRGLGHGLFAVPFYEKRAFGHNGRIDSFDSGSYHFPDDDVTVTILSSGLTITFNDILIGVLSVVFDKPYELPTFDEKSVKLSAEQLKSYEGLFGSSAFPLKITVKVEGDQLTAQATGQGAFPLTPYSETEFRFDGAGIIMIFDDQKDGQYQSFTLKQGGQNVPFKKEK